MLTNIKREVTEMIRLNYIPGSIKLANVTKLLVQVK